jgi:glycerate-2-kinase
VRVPSARYRSDEDKEFFLNDPCEFLLRMLKAAIYEALPATRVKAFLPAPPAGSTIVVGAGKAAASMSAALEASWNGRVTGLVVTRYGHRAATHQIEVVEASQKSVKKYGVPGKPPCVLLSGGETTVTAGGQGRGGTKRPRRICSRKDLIKRSAAKVP